MVVPQTTHGLPSRPRTLRKSRTFTSIGSSRSRISAIASPSTRPMAAWSASISAGASLLQKVLG